jgi:hypothetical protein
MRTSRFLLLTAAMAAATAGLGWWSVVLVSALWTIVTRHERAHPISVALSASLAWALLLGVMALRGPIATVAQVLGGILTVGAIGVFALTLLLPALLAGATAVVAGSAVGSAVGRADGRPQSS